MKPLTVKERIYYSLQKIVHSAYFSFLLSSALLCDTCSNTSSSSSGRKSKVSIYSTPTKNAIMRKIDHGIHLTKLTWKRSYALKPTVSF
mmetsp:Transcript_45726/g.138943  ORF Transcript_45726/g.138943 Transcript_45726/m.138943 type:complete len:89 (+) Transcript_45726:409-675(+)